MSVIKFSKMQGLGNDYIYINTMLYPIENPVDCAIRWSKYHTGVGSDGLVLIGYSNIADYSMRIFNSDGSEAMMCGNASRCIGKYLYDEGITTKTQITLETLSGVRTLYLHVDSDDKVYSVTVDMGIPCGIRNVDLGNNYIYSEGISVSMGNPHLVIFVDDISKVDLNDVGVRLEHHPLFPDRTNVEFAQILDHENIRMRVWERGSGITQACGTGACATAVAAMFSKKISTKSFILMDGGTLQVEYNPNDLHIYMTGIATKVFDGEIKIS